MMKLIIAKKKNMSTTRYHSIQHSQNQFNSLLLNKWSDINDESSLFNSTAKGFGYKDINDLELSDSDKETEIVSINQQLNQNASDLCKCNTQHWDIKQDSIYSSD